MSTLIGRESELEAVEHYLEQLPSGPSALLIEGPAGIGKTALWAEALTLADGLGYRVLRARPAEAEARLSYAGLADLLGPVFDDRRWSLPAPQERALATALLRADPEDAADPRTTATGVVGVLTALASYAPLVIAIDDVQWLDPASTRAVEFAARRLPQRAGLLVTRRTEDFASGVPLGLDRALAGDRLVRVVPRPLSLAGLHHLVVSRLARPLSRPTLVRIAEASGGNPFFALELARALPPGTEHHGGQPLALPTDLRELVLARVRSLPAASQDAVLVAAALSRPTVATVAAGLPSTGEVAAALLAAEDAGVVVVDRDEIRFTHPLIASAVYGTVAGIRRRELHRRLAAIVDDPEERARHLAASLFEPSETAAAQIEEAAWGARVRGAQDAAAELFEAARRLTPPGNGEELARRALGQAWSLYEAGDVSRARALADQATTVASTPRQRVQGLLLEAQVAFDGGMNDKSVESLDRALAAAGDDDELRFQIHAELAEATRLDPRRTLEHAATAENLLNEGSSPQLAASVIFSRFLAEVLLGYEARHELLERGLALEAKASPLSVVPMLWFVSTDDFAGARARHAVEDRFRGERGHERFRADRLAYRALVELRAGNWDLAEKWAEESVATTEELYPGRAEVVALTARSLVDAHRGRLDRARATVLPLFDETGRSGSEAWSDRLFSVLGFIEFAAGDYEAVDHALSRMRDWFDSVGFKEPLLDRSEPFHIESLIALGKLERARDTLARLEERGRRLPRLWIDVTLPRARALVLAAEGDQSAALSAVEELDVDAAAQLPFELACAHLLKGVLHRRMRQRRLATAALAEALAIFERLGARSWAEQAKGELARVGPRRRAPDELTATELRVAELAASGLTNREVAKAAFIAPKTVEANLARIYRKLGIHSRAELGARMRQRADEAKT